MSQYPTIQRWWLDHLEWMMDYQPDKVRSLHEAGSLRKSLSETEKMAMEYKKRLREEGKMEAWEIDNLVHESMIARMDGLDALKKQIKKPLTATERAKILEWADELINEKSRIVRTTR